MFHVRVEHPADVITSQQVARRAAKAAGFGRRACAELMIVASELASNVLKYGTHGTLRLETCHHALRGPGVRIVAEDHGPPFKSFETAQIDGFDDDGPVDAALLVSRRGTASGLGAVRRLTHELVWEPRAHGKAVIATRYLKAPARV